MKTLCVVHLIRAQNGIEPFVRFLDSYHQNNGGIDHDILFLFKGFDLPSSKDEHLRLLAPIQCITYDIPDTGFDITAYFAVAKRYGGEYRYFCFLNSYSVIQDRKWLSKLYAQISLPEVGLVGATGSWQSHRGNALYWRLPFGIAIKHFKENREKNVINRVILGITFAWQQSRFLMNYDQFPNYHLRTNAFMISGELMRMLESLPMATKLDTYKFESGRNGLTRQILKTGKKVIVVGKDGKGYEMQHWNESQTYWQDEQQNLLVSDNQTRDYQHAGADRRNYLSSVAWGNKAIRLKINAKQRRN